MKVIKKDGNEVEFSLSTLAKSICSAMIASNTACDSSVIDFMALRVTSKFAGAVRDDKIESFQIQSAVEDVLRQAGYDAAAQVYHEFTSAKEVIKQRSATTIDYKALVESYLNVADWRVKENSTVTYSIGGLILSNSGAVTANYWLSEVYDKEIADAHRNADIHIHDLSFLGGYCAGWSLKQLIQEGLGGVTGKITSAPAKHLSTLCNQMVNFLGIMQNEWAGAQAFSSFDTYLAPFVKADNLTYEQTKQCIESFVFGVNTPSRWGTQAPFSNITLDWTVPDDLAELNCIVGGKEMPFKYKDCKKEMDMVNKAFIEIMIEGDANGRGFQYPIPTYSITKDFDWSDTENNRLLFEMTSKYGTPYFSNYVNSDMEPSDIRSMCPLAATERVLVRDDFSREFHVSTIKQLYAGHKTDKEYDVILNGETKRARLHRYDNQSFYRVKTVNGHEVVLSGTHANLVLGGAVKRTDELSIDDYLPFNIVPIEGSGLSFDDGLMVGAFMGDGSLKDQNGVCFSLNDTTKSSLMGDIIKISEERYGAKVTVCPIKSGIGNGCVNVTVYSKALRGLIEDYVSGGALDKTLHAKCLERSIAFREGIVSGYYLTDGGNAKRIYTASKNAVESLTTLFMSLGMPTRVVVDERDSTQTLSDNPVYCVRPYDPWSGHRQYGNVFRLQDGYMWFKIESVEPITTGASVGYCFEVLNDDEPYFTLPNGMVTHNCRLRLDLRELRKKSGGYFGSGESTGSVGVVTINLPRLAYLSENETDFYQRLDRLMDIAARSLKLKRDKITSLLEDGLYPYTKRYLDSFANHFSTIGLAGGSECGLNAKWLRADMTDARTQQFMVDVLNHMRDRLSDYQELYGDLYNLEATPAESTAYRFAKHDLEQFPDIITAAQPGRSPFYTNSTHLPVGFTDDIFAALDVQDRLQTLYTSGTVFHAFLGEKLPDWKAAANLVRKIAENYELPYYTLSPTYSVCKEHGYITGEEYLCPVCGQPTEVYSRITGYYRPVQNWNDGKAEEFRQRKLYNIDHSRIHNAEHTTSDSETEQPATASTPQTDDLILVATKTCPNCRMAASFLEKAHMPFVKVYVEDDEDFAIEHGVQMAPTLLVPKDGVYQKILNVSNIRKYIEQNN